MTGGALSKLLRTRYGIELEMAGTSYAIAMTSICDTDKNFRRLADAIVDIDPECGEGRESGKCPAYLSAAGAGKADLRGFGIRRTIHDAGRGGGGHVARICLGLPARNTADRSGGDHGART